MAERVRHLMLKIVVGLGMALAVSSALLIVTSPLYMPYLVALAGR